MLAIAIADELEPFDADADALVVAPLPDVCERDGVVYSSRPTAIRERDGGFVLERRRETVSAGGELTVELDEVALDSVSAETLEREGADAGLQPSGRVADPGDRRLRRERGGDVPCLSRRCASARCTPT